MNPYATQNLIKKIPGFTSSFQKVNNIRIHYVIGGSGELLLLLPGWPQTWWSYRHLMPLLAQKHTVIVADLRGMGDSDKPDEGYTKKHMAALGYEKVHVAGHDIGGNVAYAFAANYPEKVKNLILLDTPPPDENMYRLPMLPVDAPVYPWWVAFNQVSDLPVQLLEGRFSLLLDHLLDKLLVDQEAVNAFDRSVYIQHYNDKKSIRASNAWYQAFGQDIADQKSYSKIKNVTKGIASPASFDILENFLSGHVLKYEMEEIEGSGHFILEEKPQETANAILDFLK